MRSWKLILLCASFFFLLAVLSFLVASPGRMFFIIQLSVNVFYACLLGIAALVCFWSLNNRPADRIAVRLVMVLSVYFCLTFLTGEARQYLPRAFDSHILYEMAGSWLPLGCGFALVSNQRSRTQDA